MGIQTVSQAVSNETGGSPFGFRNRIINGDYRIDQRNQGAALTGLSAYQARAADMCRTGGGVLTTGRYSAQRVTTISTDTGYESGAAPAGFTHACKYTVTATEADTTGASIYHSHFIEGYNVADFDFGLSTAKPFTISFWVKSSVTGTYELQLNNGASPYTAYYTSYTINSANTWEYKTITVNGPTSSSPAWSKTTGVGLRIDFRLKRDYTTAVVTNTNAWLEGTDADNDSQSTSMVNLFATLNATWYITGLQVEMGRSATPFERRPYQTELQLCQRYLQKYTSSVNSEGWNILLNYSGSDLYGAFLFPVPMRYTPTYGYSATTDFIILIGGGTKTISALSCNQLTNQSAGLYVAVTSSFTAGQACQMRGNANNGYFLFTAEF